MSYSTDPILTPVGRVSWPALAKPDDNGKYGLTMIFDSEADLKKLKAMVVECIKGEWGDKYKPAQLSLPFKNGNDKINDEGNVWPEYEDCTLATMGTKYAVTVLNPAKKPIPTAQLEAEVYGGCYCIAQVNAYAWEYTEKGKVMKRGVSLGLMNLMKVRDGERLGGGKRISAEDAFADVEVEASSDDPSNYTNDDYDL